MTIATCPLSFVNRSGDMITYRYNADGQRIFKKVGGLEPEHYIMDGDQNVAVFIENSSLKYWNIFGNGLAGRMDASGHKFYYIKDHLGSTRAVVKDDGTVVEAHDYYPFGLRMPARSYQTAERTKELFTGKELDGETGWYYHGARFRHPALGPWLSVDTLASNHLSISPYHYAHNNPVNRFDPDGKDDLGTNFLTPEEREKMWDNYARVNREGGRRKELTVATALLPTILDPMSRILTAAGSYPS